MLALSFGNGLSRLVGSPLLVGLLLLDRLRFHFDLRGRGLMNYWVFVVVRDGWGG